ncbi:MAG: 3-isopropylmalate dehydrogenase [Acidobacteria bacterium RBG_16_68_9]|nr:MAG: 3-isopropylmalate dehydrogenase [Acidobacteria bacterium RBG_16_68_9]
MSRRATVSVFPGDGVGPEVIEQARACVDLCARRFRFEVEWVEGCVGGAAIDRHGTALPDPSMRMAREGDAVLLGAVGGPQWDDPHAPVRPEQALLGLRKGLGLFANLRPIRVHRPLVSAAALKAALIEGVDIVFVRELTGGIYFGEPSERRTGPEGRTAVDTLAYTEAEVARVVRVAFALARGRRQRLTSVDKANILATSRLWREVTHEVAREFPDVECTDVLVDAMAMHLLRRPRDFDVVVTENMFGDILTDEAAMLTGSLGMLPSASLGEARNQLGAARGLYEPVHGSAPDIAGTNAANPLGAISSAAMMLRHSLAQPEAAAALEAAIERVLEAGWRTADIQQDGCRLTGCREMGTAARRELEAIAG